jgi:sRNA-binding carbon storage regulator CsrA
MDQLREVYAHVDENRVKMAIRMPDTMKVEREEIDAKWSKIQTVIEEAVQNMLTLER